MSLVVLGIPITDIWRFLLLLASVIAIVFGTPSVRPKRWLLAAVIAVVAVGLASLLPVPYIEEGENVYIPLGDNLGIFEQQLPANANAIMKAEFDRTYLATDESSVVPAKGFVKPRHWIEHAFSPSADALWQHPKYSRIVDEFSFGDQDQARVGAINRLMYNFYLVHDHAKRLHKLINPAVPALENNLNLKVVRIVVPAIDRPRMPFFVMAEINPSLLDGRACWRGNILWERGHEAFDFLRSASWTCRQITEQDLGKQLYA